MRIILPLPPKPLWPNARPHWSVKQRVVREYRQLAWVEARHVVWLHKDRPRPWWSEAQARAVFYFPDARVRDRDNAAAALKAAWDGIADAGVIANDAGLVHFPPEMRVDRERPRVELTVEEIQG